MDDYVMNIVDFVNRPAVIDTFVDILLCLVPIWVAVMIGLVIGWSWRPRWTGLICLGLRSKLRFAWTAPPGFGARRLWLAFTALSAFSVCRKLWFDFRGRKRKDSLVGAAANDVPATSGSDSVSVRGSDSTGEGSADEINCSSLTSGEGLGIVTESDLDHLLHLLDRKDGDAGWLSMMERSTSNLACQAWRYEPETGTTMYRTRTVFEDATPELVRDFFWDDEFRPKWDPMLTYIKILEECPQTGAMIIHWIKKFPFFCSDREYIIGRRIWEAGKTYYCVTKGVPYPALQRRDKPRRVDDYFSSWVIRPVLSRKGDGQFSACEVILIHYEDMGIPKDVAKVGVRHGMWGTLKKMNAGLRAYQNTSKLEASSLSRCAQMARITTKMSLDGTDNSSEAASGEEETVAAIDVQGGRGDGGIDWKWIVLGGTVAMAFGLHTGVVGKAVLFGAGQRLARRR